MSAHPSGAPSASVPLSENKQRMLAGELYHAFTPELVAERARCRVALRAYNAAAGTDAPRREVVRQWQDVVQDPTPLPPPAATSALDDALFADAPWVEAPAFIDYGYNVRLGPGVFVNGYSTWLDTCTITVGARTLLGPHVALYAGTHPLDPALRDGTRGPETGAAIAVGADCWIGGNVVILPGVTIGRGSTVGAGSVVTKDVPPFHVVAGNPARILRKVETAMDPEQSGAARDTSGAEKPMAEAATEGKAEET